MDSWVILDSMKAEEGQKGHQRELTHQNKNSVVKTERSVSSIALTIHCAKSSHYRCLSLLFCFIQANCRKEGWSIWAHPKSGPCNPLEMCAHSCSISNIMRVMILITLWALRKVLWGQMLVSEWWRKGKVVPADWKAAQGEMLSLMTCLCWIYTSTCTSSLHSAMTEQTLVWEHLGPFGRQPLLQLRFFLLLFCQGHREKSALAIWYYLAALNSL